MDYTKIDSMCDWEQDKAIFLLKTARDLCMDISGFGEVAVNTNSGYTYLWIEDYNFSLYMPISCKLKKSDIVVLWTNSEDGEEREMDLKENTSLEDIENWTEEQEKSVRVEE